MEVNHGKYYIDLASLLKWADDVTGYYKPSETMGSHHCIVSPQLDGSAFVSGSNSGNVHLLPGDKLGYNCGTVWRLKAPVTPLEKLRVKLYMKVEWNSNKKAFISSSRAESVYNEHTDRIRMLRTDETTYMAIMPDGTEDQLSIDKASLNLDDASGHIGSVSQSVSLTPPDGAVAVHEVTRTWKRNGFITLFTHILWVEKKNNKTMTALNKWAARKLKEKQ